MPTDIATLGIKIEATDIRKAVRELDRLEDQSVKTEGKVKKLRKGFSGMQSAIAALGIGLLSRQLIKQINVYTALNNKLKLVTKGASGLAKAHKVLFDIAQDTRGSLEGTIDLYSRLARSTQELNISSERLANVTRAVNQAVALSGASASTAQAALFQLGQGLGAGALRGEELNSVLEGTPELARAIANGLGKTIAQLREMGSQGKLTAEAVIGALEKQSNAVDKEFSQTSKTIQQALQQIENVALKTFGSLDGSDLIESMDEFREIISDPSIVSGLQSIASLMLGIVNLGVRAASGWGMLAKIAKDAFNSTQIENLNNQLKAQEEILTSLQERGSAWTWIDDKFGSTSQENIDAVKKKITSLKSEILSLQSAEAVGGGGSGDSGKKPSPIASPEEVANDLELQFQLASEMQDRLESMYDERAERRLEQEKANAQEWVNLWADAQGAFSRGIGDSIAGAIVDGESLAGALKNVLKNVTRQIISDMVTVAIKRAILSKTALADTLVMSKSLALSWAAPAALAATATVGGASVAANAGLSTSVALATSLAGARELGGDVVAGRSYLVGEGGEEIFTPKQTGTITNNRDTKNSLGGGATYITNNYIDAIDTKSFSDRIGESGTAVFNANANQMYENGLNYG